MSTCGFSSFLSSTVIEADNVEFDRISTALPLSREGAVSCSFVCAVMKVLQYVRTERVCWQFHIEITLAYLYIHHALLAGKVAGGDDVFACCVAKYYDGCIAVVSSRIAHHLGTRLHEVAEVFVCIVFSCVAHLACVAVYLYQCVLFPSPR